MCAPLAEKKRLVIICVLLEHILHPPSILCLRRTNEEIARIQIYEMAF